MHHRHTSSITITIILTLTLSTTALAQSLQEGNGKRWYKGNTHAHTLWSDGDAAPEIVVDWYKSRDYDFLALSDHNIFQSGDKWFPVDPGSRLTPKRLEGIVEKFGEDWVNVETNGDRTKMRLKTLPELEDYFVEKGKFLLIPAEEITSPQVHINAINVRSVIPEARPEQGASRVELMQNNFDAIDAHGKKFGIPILAHLNHPNWSEGITTEDIIAVGGERFFEVYNGHAGVKNWGNKGQGKPSTDHMWDIILAMRLSEGADHPMYGIGTDDSHDYYEFRIGLTNSGRGWVQVLSRSLEADDIVRAMKRGDFYASSGVTLNKIIHKRKKLSVHIEAEPGVTYTTQFIGTPKKFDKTSKPVLDAAGNPLRWATRIYSDDVGQVLSETTDNPATYTLTGDELYVRAKVTSSKLQSNPFAAGDLETAWTQPVTP